MLLKKNTINDTCESTVRKTLFKGEGAVTVGTGTSVVRGRQIGLISQYSTGKGELGGGLGSVDGKFLRGNIMGKGDSG